MVVRRAVLGLILALGASIAGACGDATGEPIYRNALSGPADGDGGDGNSDGPDHNSDRDCPDNVPEDDTRCPLRDHTFCSYGGGSVECECTQDNWDCHYSCPEFQPDLEDGRCENREGLDCEYGETICFCTKEASWRCVRDAESCPLEPPEPATSCPEPVLCAYGGDLSCQCDRESWICGVPGAPE